MLCKLFLNNLSNEKYLCEMKQHDVLIFLDCVKKVEIFCY